jgi:ribosome maturation factor RimP
MTEMIRLPQNIIEICEVASQVSGCAFYGAGINLEPNTISIFVEPSAENSLKSCEKVMNHIKLSWPKAHLNLLKQYHLEVSTPGLERFLITDAHFMGALGQLVRLTHKEGTKTKTVKGTLVSYNDSALELKMKTESITIDPQSIVTCNLIHDIKVQHEKS